jgi:hypothetical protein
MDMSRSELSAHAGDLAEPTFNRRGGPRRQAPPAGDPSSDRRGNDRRATQGLDGLLAVIREQMAASEREAEQLGDDDVAGDQAPERRHGPRRNGEAEAELPANRRGIDRRRRKPGLPGLFGAILAEAADAAADEPKA